MKSERILIIDDHALIVEGYKNVLLCGRGRFGGLSFEGDCMAAMQTLALTRERAPLKSGLR